MESPAATTTILMVEDEEFVRTVTAEVLQAAGYRVLTATDSTAAVRIYARHPEVDLLLTDIILPGESGWALAARMLRLNPNLPVLYMTGYPEQMSFDEHKKECLRKPFSSKLLLQKLKSMLEGIANQSELETAEADTAASCPPEFGRAIMMR